MLDFFVRRNKFFCRRPSRFRCILFLFILCLFALLLQVSCIPTGRRRNSDSHSSNIMTMESIDDFSNSRRLYHPVDRIKKMMNSFDDKILQEFFRSALNRLEDEDEGDYEEGEEDMDYQQILPPTAVLNGEPIASTSQSILQDLEIPNGFNSDELKNGPKRFARSLGGRQQSIRVELWPHHRRRRKGCPPVKDKVQFLCPSKNHHLYDVCISREQLCDHINDCPNNEDEDEKFCLFYKPLDHELKTVVHAVLLLVDTVIDQNKPKVEL